MLKQHGRQPDRLVAQFGTNGRLGRCAMVAFVEEQVERALHGRQPIREVGRNTSVKQPLGFGEHFLAAHDALFDCRMAAHERARDLINAKAAQDVENERDLRRFRQSRVTAGEHHPKQAVLDHVVGKDFIDHRR
jgi:hypothetical protein